MDDLQNTPPIYRLKAKLGRPFGYHWVGDNQKAVVLRDERYFGVRGPGWFRINPFTERVGAIINMAADNMSTPLSDIQTKDGVKFSLTLALRHKLAPELTKELEIAAQAVEWSMDKRRGILTQYAQWVLQDIVRHCYGESLIRGEGWREVEAKMLKAVRDEVKYFALNLLNCQLLRIEAPKSLEKRMENVLQRNVLMEDVKHYDAFTFNQGLRIETLETLRILKGGRHFINMGDGATPMLGVASNQQNVLPRMPPALSVPTLPPYEVKGDNTIDEKSVTVVPLRKGRRSRL